MRVYESGDSIQWLGTPVNTMLWNLVEYYDESTGMPNYFYELYNQYSRNFVAPQIGGQILSTGTIGINLAESGFSRGQEVEADDYGTDLLVKAGYSPWGLYNAMKSFKDNNLVTQPNGFNSHPPTERRLQHLSDRAKGLESKAAVRGAPRADKPAQPAKSASSEKKSQREVQLAELRRHIQELEKANAK